MTIKPVLIALSVLCLSFTFVKDFDLNDNNVPQEIPATAAAEPPAGVTGNKTSSVSDIVTKALAFKALLSTTQLSSLQLTYSASLARKWSNLPCGSGCRNGVAFSTFSAAQLNACMDLIKSALGNTANDGYDEFVANRLAEANLHANGGGNGYDTGIRFIAFLNTPSANGAWMLQFGGHHYAANIAFNNGHVIGATPFFQGLEPLSFTINNTTYAPLNDEHDALTAMLAALAATQLTTARLTSTFNDCLMVPGETNGGASSFPAKAGLVCSSLTAAQKTLVLAAIQHYVDDMDTATANNVMKVYAAEIDNTYIGYTGSGTSGDASSFLNANSNYVRIDGPTVWIELACQNGVIYRNQIHYHTIWRDHSHDYGVDLTGAAIDGTATSNPTTSVSNAGKAGTLSVYPNPSTDKISVSLGAAVSDADVMVYSLTSGQTITIASHRSGSTFSYDIARMPAGTYVLRIQDANGVYTGKFTKL